MMSVTVITSIALMPAAVIMYDEPMGRWEPDARSRLANAALELYGKRGFEQTTVEEIAKRAGLTERTFFRHFADKREVLFSGASALEEHLIRAIDDAPRSLSPIDATRIALEAIAEDFRGRRQFARRRQRIIAANAELQEREHIKLASLASSLADALRARGVGATAANLAAETGIAVFRIAFERWIDEPKTRELSQIITESFNELKSVVGSGAK
jgi:AcrR family transcriptional regulator